MTLGARVARSLEAGRGGALSSLAARAWGGVAAARLVRPLVVVGGARVIAVGGATLGGSGKTPLAIACARQVAGDGGEVVLVGHAYRARPGRCRVVSVEDSPDVVGDEALMAARALAGVGARVVVAPTRQAALDHALSLAPVAVLDGVAQLSPRRADLALLVVDGARPWGAGQCPPRGDLRAPRRALLSRCDRVVVLGGAGSSLGEAGRPVDGVAAVADGAWLEGDRLGWDAIRPRRVGLWTALARPSRVLASLERHGVVPRLHAAHGDHSPPSLAELRSAVDQARHAGVDLWLATAKCATRLPPRLDGVPVATLAYDLPLPDELVTALRVAAATTR